MESKILLSEFRQNIDLVEAYIADCSTKQVTHIEYRTFDEYFCNADVFVLPKREVRNDLEAFVTLYAFLIHFVEEWNPSDTTAENAGLIVTHFLRPDVEGYLFEELSSTEVFVKLDVVRSIIEMLSSKDLVEEKANNTDRWGVYVNDESACGTPTLVDLGIYEIESGVSLVLTWNWIEIMYRTPNSYVFFLGQRVVNLF